MALALCLTLLPTAALAEGTEGTAQTPPAVEKAADPANGEEQQENQPAEQEEQQEDSAAKQAVAAVQAMIDALPAVDELDGMDDEDAMAVYEAFQAACDAYYDTLTEEQQAQLKNTEKLAALSDWFSQPAALAESEYISPDTVDADGNIIRHTGWSRNGPIYEGGNGDADFTDAQFYVVQGNDVTIGGNLTIGGSCGLILCQGAKLTVEGALICSGSYSIYGQSNGGANAGRLVVKNSLDDGAAIRSDSTYPPSLSIYSGELEIHSGNSDKLVDGVKLYSENKVHTAALDNKQVLLAAWSDVSSIKGTSLVLTYCEHSVNDQQQYIADADDTDGSHMHHRYCTACGFTWSPEAYKLVPLAYDEETHTMGCDVCENYKLKPEGHSYENASNPVPTDDGKGHTGKVCSVCGAAGGESSPHTYGANGKCKDCEFKPAFEDSKGNLYEYNGSDSIDALNEAIKKGETSFKLVNFAQGEGADAATVEAAFALETDANVTLDMNGKTLKASGGTPVLAVSSGALTVTGDAAIIQGGASQETYKPAIEVTGGSLVFEGDLTAQGGKHGNYDRQPAVKVTGGTVEFKGALDLDGGLLLNDCERLASKLTQGSFYSDNNDQGQVYRVQIENDFQHSYDLLADGYAFAKYDTATGKAKVDGNGNPVLVDAKLSSLRMNTDVIIVAHTHSIEAGQPACACGKKLEAGIPADDGTITYYETIDEAFANVKENETVKLMIDSDDWDRQDYIYVVGGPYTFDLNGHRVGHRTDDDNRHQAFLQVGDPDGNPGTLTVLDRSDAQTGYFYELELYNGSLTVESGSFYRCWESATTATGTMTFKGGTVDVFTVTSRNVETKISGGTFGLVENNIGGKPGDLLADNRAFFNRNNGDFVNGYDDNYRAVSNVEVKNHTHNIVDGSCECGFTCAHDWSKKNGVCTVCGYHCPHNAGAAEADGVWACDTCGQTVTAMVTAPGGAITYYADGYVNNNVKSGLYFAIKAAKTGSTVAALGGEYSGGYVTGNKTLTLDVSNGKTIDGILYVGEGENDTGNKLIVRGSTEISYVIVAPGDNTLDLTGWTGRIGSLTVLNGGKATLNGGTFAKLNFNGAAAGSLLASGYAFQNADTGAYVEYSSTDNMENVKVVKCPHSGVTLKEDHTGAECKYCGASFAATLDDAPYGTIDAAVTDWLANGGTLKLYADYTAADGTWSIGSGSHTINLNGHRMSVKGDGAFFKPTNNMHLTVTDGTELGQITNILLDGSQGGSFTLENGFVGNLKMTGGAVVALKGGSVDNLDVKNCSVNTNLSIQGGSLGKLNIEDWADGMHVSATGGSLGAYSLPSGKILADVLDHQYYAEGTSLDRQVDTAAQNWKKFDIKQAPHDFGSTTSKAADVPINGSIPFMVGSPSENVGLYEVKWYRRTNSGAEHMVENKVAGVNVNDTLEVFCVITGVDRPGGEMQWQVAVKGYTIKVVPAKLNGDRTVITQKPGTGNTGNPADNRLVVTPLSSNALSDVEYKFAVTYNRQPLELNKDYTIKDSSNRAMNAGTHTLTIEGRGNYTGQKSVTWTLEPYELSVENFRHAQINKTYDGTDAVTDSTNGINALAGFMLDSKNPRNPILSTVDVFNLGKSDYQLSNMKFDSAEAGDRTFTGTMTLTSGGNFVFAGGSRVMQIEYGSSGRVSVSINRATIAAPAAKALQVANNHAATYTVDLSALLPALEAPREYGAVTYGAPTVNLSSGYYTDGARVEDGKLILPIQAVETKETGSIGSVKVKVSTTNYHDFTLTINVIAKNRITPTGTPTLSKNAITYGDALNTIALSGKLHDNVNNVDVDGTFKWVDGTHIPVVGNGTYAAEWIFEPTDTEKYLTVSGRSSITVEKAQQYGKVSMAGYTYGKTPSMPSLTEQTGDPNAQVTYGYAVADSGSVQTWDIQNPPTLNAGTYRMYASIGDTDNYYGCEAVYCEFVVAKATPTYTAPTGLTAKYGQTLADVTLPGGWSWMDSSESVGGASTVTKTFQAKFTPKDTENYNTVENIGLEVMVNKADGGSLKTVELEQKYTDASDHTYTPDWSEIPTGQTWSYNSEYSVSNGSKATLTKQDFAADGSLLTYAISGGKAGDKITITLKSSCNNYEDFTITLTITLTEKDNQQALRITGGTTVVYGQTLQLGTSGGSGAGAVTYAVTNGTGEATIDAATGKLTPVKVGTVKVKATKAADASFNEATSAEVEITITRATPTGEPAYTKITTSGKKLADAGLTTTGSTFSVPGTVRWVDDTGAALPGTTTVEANKLYKWVFTPTDSTNYESINGSIKLWNKSTSSGGGSYYAPVVPDMPMVYWGCTGDAVKTLQDKLNALGYNSGNVDGIFGAKTYAAVTAFQKANGLGVDGIVGKLTWGKLYGVSPAMPVETTAVVGRPMVSYGSRGDAVRRLQELLNALGYDCGSVDGIFGSKTKAAVLAFQKANGLGADGIVGPLTWAKLG